MSELVNIASEEAILSGLIQHGKECFVEIDQLIEEDVFTKDNNKVIYKCVTHALKDNEKIGIADILSAAKTLHLDEYVEKKEVSDKLKEFKQNSIDINNVFPHAQKVTRLAFARKMQNQLRDIYRGLNEITGEESVASILSVAEEPIQKLCLSYIKEDDMTPVSIGEGIKEYIEHLKNKKGESIGIPTGFPEFDKAIGGGLRRKCVDLISARPKALRYGSKVYTDRGYKLIEDVQVGDIIKHPFSGNVKVTHVWDHNNKDIYRVYFRDGDFVDCCEDHLWHVSKTYGNKKEEIKPVKDLINDITYGKNKAYKWNVPLTDPLEFDKQDIPIDPYVMGVLLGDGSIANNTCVYHTADDEIHQYMLSYATSIGCDVKIDSNRKDNKVVSYRINSMQNRLRDAGIFGHNCYSKFIPKNYIYNTKEIRLKVLAGLLDTDGDCTIDKRSKKSRTRFTSVSKQLCLDVKEIVQSLGGLCSIVSNKTSCNGKDFYSYRCEVRLPHGINPFKLKRKADKFTNRVIGRLKRTIVKIEKVGIDNARCLTLSNNDGLFITDNFVVTHNTGKSVVADNVALHIAGKYDIPVLMLDTEMSKEDHHHRLLANLANVEINEIASGSFADDPEKCDRIDKAGDYLENIPYKYISISGRPFEETLSIAKRWLLKEVGYDENGRLNDCVIINDYLKLMSSTSIKDNLAEFQVLGFQITALHNFCVENDCPCLSFVQLNRDGITRESTDVVSGSDRLVWLCTSFSIFKEKTEDEKTSDGLENGNRKLIPIVSRHGPGIQDEGYICLNMEGEYARLTEIGTIRQIKRQASANEEGFEDQESEDEDDGEDSRPF